MKGSVHFRKDRGVWFVLWYHKLERKEYKIYRYKGELMYSERVAQKLLAVMQGDTENGTFRIEKFTGHGWTDTVPYLYEWLDVVKNDLSPATYKDYRNSIKNHLEPFFTEHPFQLHEIQYDVLRKLLNSINREGKGRANVMYCLHACLTYAWRSRRIPDTPPFPEKKHYRIQEKTITWLPEDRQLSILEKILKEHQPIFYWLKYHLRRPGEAMALHRVDYDSVNDLFIVRRSISARTLVNRTKTGVEHVIPCHSLFRPFIKKVRKDLSPYFFTCSNSRSEGKRYTSSIMNRIWKEACKKANEQISMYDGLKHSSCSQYVNEKNMALSDLQLITDHARLDSVKRYAKVEVSRRRELMEGNVVKLKKVRE
ncbi:tyrosine-type recombinase/integrase [Desulfofustis glycolicus]|uniref:Phage integrase, N-terminal SAM-like domain n=1 Tax=Desulfofustis glycolicus DSM 9705 TaxID=1121409 RepID=A0A1M5SF10_9BACT|nr:site-specific integrase [Desulfofustis glycolicus]MCB2216119.1 tyrosine-type recombinase/integrase [Desulfobulbaceae bacterium]SHH37071.1 Phage integrase, N-terminal SAM-like domain [Desulfofustis glycolicus DSM 9705]